MGEQNHIILTKDLDDKIQNCATVFVFTYPAPLLLKNIVAGVQLEYLQKNSARPSEIPLCANKVRTCTTLT